MNIKGRFSVQEKQIIAERYLSGQSMAKISRDMYRSEFSIRKHLVKLGIFRFRKISEVSKKEDKFFPLYKKYKITLFSTFIWLPLISIFLVLFPEFNPLESFLIICFSLFNL